MCSSPQNPNRRPADAADRIGTAAGLGTLVGAALALAVFGGRIAWAPDPGEMRIHPETTLQFALAPVREIAPPPEPEPEPVVETPPGPESELEIAPESEPEPEPVSPPGMEAAPSEAAQPVAELAGDSGEEEAIRAEWLGELRRRIEQNKFYPAAARCFRETGTVRVRVRIGPAAEIGEAWILENTGSTLLAEGARRILRRAANMPLGTNTLSEGFQVDVPITYRIGQR